MLHLTSALPEWSSWPNDGDDESPVPCVMRIVRGQMRSLTGLLLLFFPPQRSRHLSGVVRDTYECHAHQQVPGFSFLRCGGKMGVDFLDNNVPH